MNFDHFKFISGMIGIGKSALAARFAQQVQDRFEYVIWRSLRNAPSIQETIDTFIHFFAHEPDKPLPDTLDSKIVQLLFYLRQHRCLLILDDLQSILADGDRCLTKMSAATLFSRSSSIISPAD